tara:strand:- start:287 stop:1315 length:1029 start_codon:yes stop_codon:yes gene_type:complete
MRFSIRLAVAALCPFMLAAGSSLRSTVSADDLFSDVALESVFQAENDSSLGTALSADLAGGTQRVTGAGSLARVLESAGLQPKKLERSVVSVTIRQAGWSLPVLMSVAVDQDRLDMVMLLTEISDNSEWDTSRLTRLFAANAEESTVFFALSKSRQRIELRRSMSNRMITPARLKDELMKMALVAETYEDTWANVAKNQSADSTEASDSLASKVGQPAAAPTGNSDSASSAATTTDVAAQPDPAPQADAARMTLVGRWSASLASGEAFAVQIARDGKFQLVIAKSGKTTVSSGTATRDGNQLTLVDTKGVKIAGTVTQPTPDTFALMVGGNASVTLNFKRAK